MVAVPIDTQQIVITSSRTPEPESRTSASVVIIDQTQVRRLGSPLIPSYLRLTPSAAVSTSGPLGSLTDVRIRGAEANHTLLFIDGIRANDPAAGDAPRFELLNADLVSRIEVVRGPQSALWGSDAIGGVIAVNGADEFPELAARAEGGSFGFARASASGGLVADRFNISGAAGWQRGTGIDSFGASGGDKDGYRNLSARLRGKAAVGQDVAIGGAAFVLTGRTQFDGYNPFTGEHTDTLDNTRNKLRAARLWASFGRASSSWSGYVAGSLLGSSNRNFLADDPLNRTRGSRRTIDAQLQHAFATGRVQHQLIFAAEAESEEFVARGFSSGLPTDQDRNRSHQSATAEWRAATGGLSGDVALRRDFFNRFKDTTTFRISGRAEIGHGFALTGSYAEGLAQPTFFDLYGTFPNIFVGNPNLKSETSCGFEGSLRFRRASIEATLTAYRQWLHDEIVDVFDFTTFTSTTENTTGISRRSGLEAELGWQVGRDVRLRANYAFLHAVQPSNSTALPVKERRRPKHSGALELDGAFGRWSYGASITYAGRHIDTLEVAPFGPVAVKSYWVADARVACAVTPRVELFVRGSNLFDSNYQEVAGYHTEGLGAFVGVSLRGDRRSSP